jgi:hypothetical protein
VDLPRGYHIEPMSGALRKVHEPDAPRKWYDQPPAAAPRNGYRPGARTVRAALGLPLPPSDSSRYRYAATAVPATLAHTAAAIAKAAAQDLGLPHAPQVGFLNVAPPGTPADCGTSTDGRPPSRRRPRRECSPTRSRPSARRARRTATPTR